MALDKLVDSTQLDSALTATANAIRVKTGDSGTITWNASTGFANAVGDIQTGATVSELSITENGTYTAPTGTAYSPVTVTVPKTTVTSLNVTRNSTYTAPTGIAYSPVTVNVPSTTVTALNIISNGTYVAPTGSAYNPVVVNIQNDSESGAVFIDYDGTELYKYTTEEALELTGLPANPTHTGLTAQGWNWSLANIKSYLQNYPTAIVVVGQMYITDDGKTRIYVHLKEEQKSPRLYIYLKGTVYVDWGDGTTADTVSGTNVSYYQSASHNYSIGGDYVIRLTPEDDSTELTIGGESQGSNLLVVFLGANESSRLPYNNAITKVEIGKGFEKLLSYAFKNCGSLESITIPNSIYNMTSSGLFSNCYSLKGLVLPSSAGGLATNGCEYCQSIKAVSIPVGANSFGSGAFTYCYSLKYITIPNYVTKLDNNCLYDCFSLKNVIIPSNITTIANGAFSDCWSIKNLIIPNNVTSIGINAFSRTRLTSITIPDDVTKISNSMFLNCYSLETIILPDGLTSIGTYAFDYCHSLKSIEIPDSVTTIGAAAFRYNYSLRSAILPDGLSVINDNLFNACRSLAYIEIPNNVTSIGTNAFNGCRSLVSVTIPSGVTTIKDSAFSSCMGIRAYHLKPINPPTLGSTRVFANIASDCIIYVPYSADHSILAAYQAANYWKSHASKMQEEPQ